MESFNVLFHKNGNPKDAPSIKSQISGFSAIYDKVISTIIANSVTLSRDTFRFNVATLLPSFKMTRRGAFHGLKIVNRVIEDPNNVLDTCWIQVNRELENLKMHICKNTSNRRRAVLELSQESRNYAIEKVSELFEKLKWISVNDSNIGRVGATKILFAVLPEIALPVDNAEWNHLFRTDNYSRVLLNMINEINEWERRSNMPIDRLDPRPTTVTSIYNVMAIGCKNIIKRF